MVSHAQGMWSAQQQVGGVTLSVAECDDLLSRYAPRSVDKQTLPPLPFKLAF